MNDYLNVDNRWNARALPHFERSAVIISAWTTDAELDDQADDLAARYGTDADDLHDLFHAVRTHLRVAALDLVDRAASSLMTEAVAVTSNMDHLITHATTDSELAAYADAAESGAGGPITGLVEELRRLRDAERRDRVFVAGAGSPRIANLHEEA